MEYLDAGEICPLRQANHVILTLKKISIDLKLISNFLFQTCGCKPGLFCFPEQHPFFNGVCN
jgi:hypothetical protein